MAAFDDELDEAIAEMIEFAGETVTIRSNTSGLVYEGLALVTGGAGEFESVVGGYYEKGSYTVSVSKADLTTFTPEPSNLVEVRGEEMRIPDDGVTNLRRHYRLTVVRRDSPK